MKYFGSLLFCCLSLVFVACGSKNDPFAAQDSPKGAQLLEQYEKGSQRVKEMSVPGYWRKKGNQVDPVAEMTKVNDELSATLQQLSQLIQKRELSKKQFEKFKEITGVNDMTQ